MLTIQAWRVLRGMKKLTGNSDARFFKALGSPVFIMELDSSRSYDASRYQNELNSIVYLLEADGLVREENQFKVLTQKGIHFGQYLFRRFLRYLGENWISFFALLVAVAALVVSIIGL